MSDALERNVIDFLRQPFVVQNAIISPSFLFYRNDGKGVGKRENNGVPVSSPKRISLSNYLCGNATSTNHFK